MLFRSDRAGALEASAAIATLRGIGLADPAGARAELERRTDIDDGELRAEVEEALAALEDGGAGWS